MKVINKLNKIAKGLTVKEATELSLKETTEKFYKISEGLANKKRKKEDEILDKIEEKKIPGKLDYFKSEEQLYNMSKIILFNDIVAKINEIIDYLKSKGE